MPDRILKCTDCQFSGPPSEWDTQGMDRQCPECGGAARLTKAGDSP